MAVKINALSEKELRSIGDAFGEYEYGDNEWGMSYLCKGSRATSDYICAYAKMMVGVDTYYSEVLPEEKADFVKKEKAQGRKVIMIGDGINDSPALSEADAGIAISTGAAIAKEIADITISADNLEALVTLKELSNALSERIDGDYRFIMGFNATLILLGVGGIIWPTTSALLHNASTLGISLKSMTKLL